MEYRAAADTRRGFRHFIWRNYILLTRVEAAFRSLKSPLCERPIFHHLERRVETHIFLCVLAYHLLVCIERAFLDQGIHTSWDTLRRQLSTHQVVTVRLPTADGRVLTIRRDTRPEKIHSEIYRALRVPERILLPINRWTQRLTRCTETHKAAFIKKWLGQKITLVLPGS